jgi:hypothetical protein
VNASETILSPTSTPVESVNASGTSEGGSTAATDVVEGNVGSGSTSQATLVSSNAGAELRVDVGLRLLWSLVVSCVYAGIILL